MTLPATRPAPAGVGPTAVADPLPLVAVEPHPLAGADPAGSDLSVSDLAGELAALETMRYTDRRGLHERALAVLAVASRHGLVQEQARARLVIADEAGRADGISGAFEDVHAILRQGRANGDAAITARAEGIVAWCLWRMGAMGEALSHAVEAVRCLPDAAPAHFRVDHLMVLALMSALQSGDDSYVEPFQRVLADAEQLGNPHLLLASLNNFAWTCWSRGRAADALPLVARMEEVARDHGIALNSTLLDTVASVLLDVGQLTRAEEVAQSILDPGVADAEARATPEALLTLAKLRHRRGLAGEALELVLRAEVLAAERGLPEITATATEDKSRLLAETGDHRGAYEALRTAHETSKRMRDRESDARATALHALFETDQMRRRSLALEELAERDSLTGLWNRRHLDRLLPDLLADHRGRGVALSVAIADLDHFKHINDTRSHLVGDATLARLGLLLERAAPEPGFTARLGGEEFVFVLPGMDAARAAAFCESVRARVHAQRWDLITDGLGVTVSIGVATAPPAGSVADLLGRADEALYVAKRSGRDQVRSDAS